jgi:hypothetical protein
MSTLDEVFAAHGVHTRPLRLVVTELRQGWRDLDELVRTSTAPRRSVQELLAAVDGDLEHDGAAVRLRAGSADAYASFATTVDDPLAAAGEARPELLSALTRHIEQVPPPLPALDHVQATPETVLRRALWLDAQYDLGSTRLLFLGDHDLTSLAVRALRPDADLSVVDVDDRLLAYLDHIGERTIRTVHADLRMGLPPVLADAADVVFSDPPYTPEGMGLFAERGLAALADPGRGRMVLAYGYSPRTPALGAQVQRALARLGLVFEAILPGFNRYAGAQAIGSAADLYVCQPTGRASGGRGGKQEIYTHGPQSVEASGASRTLLDGVADIAARQGHRAEVRKADWSKPVTAGEGTALVLDLAADPGPWLLRLLLAVNAERVAVLLPNNHPDLADARSQQTLADLVGAKYRLRPLRSTPDNKHAVLVADAMPDESAVSSVWRKAHGKLGNTAREALAARSGRTKNEARALLADKAADLLDHRLIDVPRHRLAELCDLLTGAMPAG